MTKQELFNRTLFLFRINRQSPLVNLIDPKFYHRSLELIALDSPELRRALETAGIAQELELVGRLIMEWDIASDLHEPRRDNSFEFAMKQIADEYGLTHYPTTCVIAPAGKGWETRLGDISAKRLSQIDATALACEINELIVERDLSQAIIRLTSKAITIVVNE